MAGRKMQFDRTVENLDLMLRTLSENGQVLSLNWAPGSGFSALLQSREAYTIQHDSGPSIFDAVRNLYSEYVQNH